MILNELHQSILIKEAGLASSSLEHGLTMLRKAEFPRRGDYYQAFFQLSIGLERLMKLIIIEDYYGKENKFPNNKVLRGYGHKLTDLYKYVSTIKISNNKNPCDDSIICNSILNLLSDFAVSSRYYNLDLLTQGSTRNNDPLVAWKDIQNNIRSIHKRKLTKKDMAGLHLASILDEHSVTFFYNENNEVVSTTKDLYMQTYDNDYIQGYATLYTRKLVIYLVSILVDIEYKYNMFPYLREFFEYIDGEWGTASQIRKKKSWVKL